jgi:hypothetical protein
MVADDLSGTLKKLAVTGATTSMEEALFEVKNKDGQTIFAVYNEGVRVYVSDGDVKGVKGGFAIGGFDNTKGTIQDIFVVNSDSIRAYIDDNQTGKGVKGGFAIGGFDNTKALTQDYFKVSPDSIRLYVDNNPSVKGVKGGFAIGGFDNTKGSKQDLMIVSSDSVRIYLNNDPLTQSEKGGFSVTAQSPSGTDAKNLLHVTIDSTRIFAADSLKGFAVNQGADNSGIMNINRVNISIGHESGLSLSSASSSVGIYNTFLGYRSGENNTTGRSNNFFGYMSGLTNNGDCNIFIGKESGKNNNTGGYNIFMGNQTGFNNNDGTFNAFLGWRSGYKNIGGDGNIFLGFLAGYENTEGNNNIFIGYNAGNMNTTASNNIFLGNGAGKFNSSGFNNLYLGYGAGYQGTTGHDNVFIGFKSGYFEPNNYRLYIANSLLLCPPLIYGNFIKQQVTINGDSLINSTHTFYVNGDAGGTTSWISLSDERLKTDIQSIDNPLDKVLALRGVNYYWKDKIIMGDDLQMGFIAQETNKVIPEVVGKNGDLYNMQYAPITALLVEGMKEQQKQIESAQQENLRLKSELDELKALVNALINQKVQISK